MNWETNDKKIWRHEHKYLCDAMQTAVLKARAEGLLCPDPHAGEDGSYRIRSLYLDGIHNFCYYENENGTDERAKYRIRIYNEQTSLIQLEKKEKRQGMTHKDAFPITEQMCRQFMEGQIPKIEEWMETGLKMLLAEIQYQGLRPAVIVEYERVPFVEANGNVRVTFDEGICSSQDFEAFFDSFLIARPILKPGQGILEVKWDSHLPDPIRRQMQLDTLSQSTFSKYYLCRKYNCHGGSIG